MKSSGVQDNNRFKLDISLKCNQRKIAMRYIFWSYMLFQLADMEYMVDVSSL
jgi:hypothetical protein